MSLCLPTWSLGFLLRNCPWPALPLLSRGSRTGQFSLSFPMCEMGKIMDLPIYYGLNDTLYKVTLQFQPPVSRVLVEVIVLERGH